MTDRKEHTYILELKNRLAGKRAITEEDLPAIRAYRVESGISRAQYWTAVFLGLGDYEQALDSIETAVGAGEPWVFSDLRSERFNVLHAQPRYPAILEQAGMDEASIESLGIGS